MADALEVLKARAESALNAETWLSYARYDGSPHSTSPYPDLTFTHNLIMRTLGRWKDTVSILLVQDSPLNSPLYSPSIQETSTRYGRH